MEGLAVGSVCSSFVCDSGERREAGRVENTGIHIALASTPPSTSPHVFLPCGDTLTNHSLRAPESMLSPAGFHVTPFALAARGVSRILSEVESVD
jgi:hypothetical protein